MIGLEAEGVHCLYRFCFPVWDDLRIVFIQPEMLPDIKVEIVLIPFVAKQCIRL